MGLLPPLSSTPSPCGATTSQPTLFSMGAFIFTGQQQGACPLPSSSSSRGTSKEMAGLALYFPGALVVSTESQSPFLMGRSFWLPTLSLPPISQCWPSASEYLVGVLPLSGDPGLSLPAACDPVVSPVPSLPPVVSGFLFLPHLVSQSPGWRVRGHRRIFLEPRCGTLGSVCPCRGKKSQSPGRHCYNRGRGLG